MDDRQSHAGRACAPPAARLVRRAARRRRLPNDEWRDNVDAEPLSREGFQAQLVLASLQITTSRLTLYFACGDLFAGHSVEVRMSPELEVREVGLSG